MRITTILTYYLLKNLEKLSIRGIGKQKKKRSIFVINPFASI
jgi:hypothetical protein